MARSVPLCLWGNFLQQRQEGTVVLMGYHSDLCHQRQLMTGSAPGSTCVLQAFYNGDVHDVLNCRADQLAEPYG